MKNGLKLLLAALFITGLGVFAGLSLFVGPKPHQADNTPISAPHTIAEADLAAAAATLDSYHAAAATADWERYFGLMSDNSYFLGTDSSERWGKEEFSKYASKTKGWIYAPSERHLTPAGTGNAIFFDEILENQSYGRSRGSGLLIRQNGRWLIAQYHLTFPIPNDLAREMTAKIKAWRAAQ